MDTATTRRVAQEYVAALEARDWAAVAALLADDVVYEMPQSHERIAGREAYVRFNQEYPGDWHLAVRRAVADGPHAAVWVDARVGDEPMTACVWLELSDDGLVRHVTDFWPEPYEPPTGREHLVTRT